MVKILQDVKIKILCKHSSSMLNLHRVLFCTGIEHNHIMQIDCLSYKYFVFNRFSLVGYNIWFCVVYDYRGTPPPPKPAQFASIGIIMSINDNY